MPLQCVGRAPPHSRPPASRRPRPSGARQRNHPFVRRSAPRHHSRALPHQVRSQPAPVFGRPAPERSARGAPFWGRPECGAACAIRSARRGLGARPCAARPEWGPPGHFCKIAGRRVRIPAASKRGRPSPRVLRLQQRDGHRSHGRHPGPEGRFRNGLEVTGARPRQASPLRLGARQLGGIPGVQQEHHRRDVMALESEDAKVFAARLAPPWMSPMVTTAGSRGLSWRLTIVCS